MAHDAVTTADVLGLEQSESQIAEENSRIRDSEYPGVTPGTAGHAEGISRVAGSATEPERYEPSEVVTEIAPERPDPSEVVTEIAPERPDPSEIITEIAPEVAPEESADTQ